MNVNAKTGGHRHKVFLDGEDVSRSCQEADDLEGYVLMIVKKDGKTQLTEDRRNLLRETKRGVVRIECMTSPCAYCEIRKGL